MFVSKKISVKYKKNITMKGINFRNFIELKKNIKNISILEKELSNKSEELTKALRERIKNDKEIKSEGWKVKVKKARDKKNECY